MLVSLSREGRWWCVGSGNVGSNCCYWNPQLLLRWITVWSWGFPILPFPILPHPSHALHQASLSFTISWSLLKLMSIKSVMPTNHLILCRPFFLLPLVFPSIRVFSNESALCIRWPKYWSFSFSINLPMNIQDWFPLGLTGLISLQSKGTLKESSPTPQFKSINSLAVSLLYGPTFTSIHDYWKNHSFDYTDLCLWSNVSAF